MIPKILHFIWVGHNPKPELVLKCMDSWKKYCPDYEIKEWGNDVLKQIDNPYVQEAFEAKKWAFVSDYVRLWALKKYGGFYVDSDLEITQSLNTYLENRFVSGYESYHGHISPITALMGAEKNSRIIETLLREYDGRHFILPDGSYDQTTNTVSITKLFEKEYGLKAPYSGTSRTLLGQDGILEPYWIFCTPENGKTNYSVHHFNASWLDPYSRKNKWKGKHLSFVRFIQNRPSNNLPIEEGEHLLCRFHISKKKSYALIWKK